MKLRVPLFILIAQLVASWGLAVSSPDFLYHWTSGRGLNRWADYISTRGSFAFEMIDPDSLFVSIYPEFKNREGVFTWSNLATGMGSFSYMADEWYARERRLPDRTTDPARLVAIKLLPNVPVLELDTYLDYSRTPLVLTKRDSRISHLDQGAKTGLVLHRIFDSSTGQLVLQEYVLLKKSFVQSITANPAQTRALMEKEVRNLRSGKIYSSAELHSLFDPAQYGLNSPDRRIEVLERLEHAMNVKPSQVPTFFKQINCRQLLAP